MRAVDDAWVAKTQASVTTTLDEIFVMLGALRDAASCELVTRAWRCKDAVKGWAAERPAEEALDALLDDVASLYGEVIAIARHSSWSRDLRRT
jgi:hypothetical protein